MIVVFGSLNVDFFLKVKAFPKPGETVLTPRSVVRAGGKGANQAAAAAKAGARVEMIGAVGTDATASVALDSLRTAGVDFSGVLRMKDEPTGMAMITVDEKAENSIVVASGANAALTADAVPDALLTPDTVLVVQLETPVAEVSRVLRRAKEKGATTVLNAAPAAVLDDETLKAADWVIVNETEAETLTGQKEQSFEKAVSELAEKAGGNCILTAGAKGAFLSSGGKTVRAGTLPIRPVDTTGAGDCFVGVFAAMIDAKTPLPDALKAACAGAGLACLKTGAQDAQPSLAEIRRAASEIKIEIR